MVTGAMDVRGTSRYTLNLGTGLVQRGWAVHLVCGEGALIPELRAAGVKIYPKWFHRGRLQRPLAARMLAHATREIQPDVVHAQTEGTLAVAVAALRRQDVPLFLTSHRVLQDGRPMPPRRLERVTRVIAVTDVVRADLVNHRRVPRDRIVTIHTGVPEHDPERALPAIGARTPVVGMMGRMDREKGIEHFLAAARQVARSRPETLFLVAGDGPARNAAKDEAVRLGVDKKVCFAAAVPDHRHVFNALDILVVPSADEGLGMAILEAMALGKPVVATARSSTYIAIRDGETGLLVPPAQPEALAEAVLSLLADTDGSKRMGAAARDQVRRKFSVASMVARTEALYLGTRKEDPAG
jgi:glycosyltransferase involved in cell wall biosynthesis